jgi:N-formylglutamate deformylase
MLRNDTLRGLGLWGEEIRESLIFHIPHAKTHFPFYDGFDMGLVEGEVSLLTDHATDELFAVPDTAQLVFPHSRVFCDVERLPDESEPMHALGRGFFYTKTDSGLPLREEFAGVKERVLREYYEPHHARLTQLVDERVEKLGFATIIDCHSFADTPFSSDLDKSEGRPDICIGADAYHTPNWAIRLLEQRFAAAGLSVKVNSPYSGTIVPMKHYLSDQRVMSVMIEINRRLYMEDGQVQPDRVRELNGLIQSLFKV